MEKWDLPLNPDVRANTAIKRKENRQIVSLKAPTLVTEFHITCDSRPRLHLSFAY